MDGRRFDQWTRGIVDGASRRGVIKALAGSALAGVAVRVGIGRATVAAACDYNGDSCDRDRDCCEGLICRRGECIYARDCGGRRGDACKRDDDCCRGFLCDRKECVREHGCGRRKDPCAKDRDCCRGYVCKRDVCVGEQNNN